ncbi:MAG: cupin domain-containing protein [Phreatobacter sp.]|uniref:cupin domain-containing protein n=1 Tax=Phreatobacter sp. TaxID=1966341 RepID=UPI001A36CA79|nr:cupin domain-containing protein [Phreatobacter sp.]MBL8569558.1 cupin domain-containing protein [Phreatobacter sp.]
MSRRYVVRADEAPPYHPANHVGTTNRRLISPDTVGARHLEVVHGTIKPGQGALPHAHPDLEQVCYMLEGRAVAEVGGIRYELQAGDSCYFPPGERHIFEVVGDRPAKLLVIYSPPYGENPAQVIRG